MSDLQRSQVVELPHDALDERGFTFTVLAHKRHFLASADGKSDVMEHIMLSEILTQVFHNKRKISAAWCGRETEIQSAGILQIHF